LAGICLTLVAVGILSEASIFDASVFAIPRKMFTSGWASSSECATEIEPVAGRLAGTGAEIGLETTVLATGMVIDSVFVTGVGADTVAEAVEAAGW
jgi:hypothetical protein